MYVRHREILNMDNYTKTNSFLHNILDQIYSIFKINIPFRDMKIITLEFINYLNGDFQIYANILINIHINISINILNYILMFYNYNINYKIIVYYYNYILYQNVYYNIISDRGSGTKIKN